LGITSAQLPKEFSDVGDKQVWFFHSQGDG
jgi:hypothetical protein